MRTAKLWRGLTSVLALLLALLIGLGSVAFSQAGFVNDYLHVETYQIVEDEGEKAETDYYKSAYGDVLKLTTEDLDRLIADEEAHAVQEMEEGAVLLHNNGALPLQSSERRVTLFGRAVADPVYKGFSNGGSRDPNRQISFYDAMKDAGFEINETLYEAYAASETARITAMDFGPSDKDIGEESISFYTEALKATFDHYSDAAIVLLSRDGGEMGDPRADSDADGVPQLSFHQDEKDLLEMIRSSGKFGKIIVLLNSGYPMDLGWLEEYGVDACLWIGEPGLVGFKGVANLLTGSANPSGKLVDTWAADSLSSPAMRNAGSISFTNAEEVAAKCLDGAATTTHYVVYAEGIYVGYKYYETRYEDCVLGQGGADAPVGMHASAGGAWNYADETVYPFGYGLSYTTFEQKLDSVKVSDDEIVATITVTNTGGAAGKSVVEVYAQTPYTDYDRKYHVEKSAIQLAGFGKTALLQPGASEQVTVTIDKYLLASYDAEGAKGYILDEGNYYLAIGDNCHDALNNVLACKAGGTVDGKLVDTVGNPVRGNTDKVYTWKEKFDDTRYRTTVSGAEVTNLFEDADINAWIPGSVTYLTRSDWENTYPETVRLTATDAMIEELNGFTYKTPDDAPAVSDFTQGVPAGINFVDMKGVPYDSDVWEQFIDQLAVEEMASLSIDQVSTTAVNSVGKPANINQDGPDGVQGVYKQGDQGLCTAYTSEIVAASAWNTDLISKRGSFLGEDALFAGVTQLWCPGANLHRTPYGGRNFEYYSEDSVLSYLLSTVQAKAMCEKGVNVAPKHFAGNDQETWRCGLATFTNEQTWRQGDLKAFEGMFTKAGVTGTMLSYSRIGCTTTSQSHTMLTKLLRDEWGFTGSTITDNAMQPYFGYQHTLESLVAGSDQYCYSDRTAEILAAVDGGDGYILQCLRQSAKNYMYAYANSNLVNGLSSNTRIVSITPWWANAITYTSIALSALTLVCFIGFVVSDVRTRKQTKSGKEE